MQIRSLGFRTDLALLRLGGSEVEDRGDHVVVRSPHNPGHWWGNFLLLELPPAPDETDRWLDAFAHEFPEAGHIALGFDGVDATAQTLIPFAARGLSVEAQAVMTATGVREPPRPNRHAEYRSLSGEDDWEQLVDLRMSCIDEGLDPRSYRDFAVAKVATVRGLVEGGHGAWSGGRSQREPPAGRPRALVWCDGKRHRAGLRRPPRRSACPDPSVRPSRHERCTTGWSGRTRCCRR